MPVPTSIPVGGTELMPNRFANGTGAFDILTYKNSRVFQFAVSNPTGAPVSVALRDAAGTASWKYIVSDTVAASTTKIWSFPEGVPAQGGLEAYSPASTYYHVAGYANS